MRKLILPLAAASILLSGCVVAPYYPAGPGYYRQPHHDYYAAPARGYYRDRDGDGIPNRYDRAPGNPYRY